MDKAGYARGEMVTMWLARATAQLPRPSGSASVGAEVDIVELAVDTPDNLKHMATLKVVCRPTDSS